MALSGLDIYKLLPKTNCKKCGFQTCLAFAMQLAKKAVSLDKCPLVTSEVRSVLEEASQPAIRFVEIGTGDDRVAVGHETVLFRHEEKFRQPTAIGFMIDDDITENECDKALAEIAALNFERVGQKIGVNLIALRERSKNKTQFFKLISHVTQKTRLGCVLMPASIETLAEALKLCASKRPLVYCRTSCDFESFAHLCKDFKVPLAVCGNSVEELSLLTNKASSLGVRDLVLDVVSASINEKLWQLTQIRRLAIRKSERSLGFPTIAVMEGVDEIQNICQAAGLIAKYASIILLKTRKPELILPLLTLRQNIFTDPQKPLQVEPNVYSIGNVSDTSPLLITTNFSLTYYTVLGEIESSRIPAHLICLDTEGMSVLTAWAAEKFTPEKISDTLVKFKLEERLKHKNLIIPGYVAMMSGDLEEKSGWNILVGPREAAGLSTYLKNMNT